MIINNTDGSLYSRVIVRNAKLAIGKAMFNTFHLFCMHTLSLQQKPQSLSTQTPYTL